MHKLILFILVVLLCSSNKSDFTFTLPADIFNGFVVGTVKAYTEDKGETITYKIISGNTNTSFKIASVTGVLTISNTAYINSRSKKYFDLVVRVTDSSPAKKSAQATVTVITKK